MLGFGATEGHSGVTQVRHAGFSRAVLTTRLSSACRPIPSWIGSTSGRCESCSMELVQMTQDVRIMRRRFTCHSRTVWTERFPGVLLLVL
jgi:hypothetical protein